MCRPINRNEDAFAPAIWHLSAAMKAAATLHDIGATRRATIFKPRTPEQ
jgi:hypothetical protein